MSNHKQPLEVARLKGALKWNPGRYQGRTKKNPRPLGQPPKHLSEDVKACWFELETYSLPGVLTASERVTMELLASLLQQFRKNPEGFPANKMSLAISCLGRLGMTPADRQKIVVKEDAKDDEQWAEFCD